MKKIDIFLKYFHNIIIFVKYVVFQHVFLSCLIVSRKNQVSNVKYSVQTGLVGAQPNTIIFLPIFMEKVLINYLI